MDNCSATASCKHEPVVNCYEKPATRAALVDLFAADFEAFGYPTALD
jgi:hypothetical protein